MEVLGRLGSTRELLFFFLYIYFLCLLMSAVSVKPSEHVSVAA